MSRTKARNTLPPILLSLCRELEIQMEDPRAAGEGRAWWRGLRWRAEECAGAGWRGVACRAEKYSEVRKKCKHSARQQRKKSIYLFVFVRRRRKFMYIIESIVRGCWGWGWGLGGCSPPFFPPLPPSLKHTCISMEISNPSEKTEGKKKRARRTQR